MSLFVCLRYRFLTNVSVPWAYFAYMCIIIYIHVYMMTYMNIYEIYIRYLTDIKNTTYISELSGIQGVQIASLASSCGSSQGPVMFTVSCSRRLLCSALNSTSHWAFMLCDVSFSHTLFQYSSFSPLGGSVLVFNTHPLRVHFGWFRD